MENTKTFQLSDALDLYNADLEALGNNPYSVLAGYLNAVEEYISAFASDVHNRDFRKLVAISCKLEDAIDYCRYSTMEVVYSTRGMRAKKLWELDALGELAWFLEDLEAFTADQTFDRWQQTAIDETFAMIECIRKRPRDVVA